MFLLFFEIVIFKLCSKTMKKPYFLLCIEMNFVNYIKKLLICQAFFSNNLKIIQSRVRSNLLLDHPHFGFFHQ